MKWLRTSAYADHQYQYIEFTNDNSNAGISQFSITRQGDDPVELKIIGNIDTIIHEIIDKYNTKPDFKRIDNELEGKSSFIITGGFNTEKGLHAIKNAYYISQKDRLEIRSLFGFPNLFYDERSSDKYAVAYARQLGFLKASCYATNKTAETNNESTCLYALGEFYRGKNDFLSAIKLYVLVPEGNDYYNESNQQIYHLTLKLLDEHEKGLVTLTVPDIKLLNDLSVTHCTPAYRFHC